MLASCGHGRRRAVSGLDFAAGKFLLYQGEARYRCRARLAHVECDLLEEILAARRDCGAHATLLEIGEKTLRRLLGAEDAERDCVAPLAGILHQEELGYPERL